MADSRSFQLRTFHSIEILFLEGFIPSWRRKFGNQGLTSERQIQCKHASLTCSDLGMS